MSVSREWACQCRTGPGRTRLGSHLFTSSGAWYCDQFSPASPSPLKCEERVSGKTRCNREGAFPERVRLGVPLWSGRRCVPAGVSVAGWFSCGTSCTVRQSRPRGFGCEPWLQGRLTKTLSWAQEPGKKRARPYRLARRVGAPGIAFLPGSALCGHAGHVCRSSLGKGAEPEETRSSLDVPTAGPSAKGASAFFSCDISQPVL